jgi:hypothetical protein
MSVNILDFFELRLGFSCPARLVDPELSFAPCEFLTLLGIQRGPLIGKYGSSSIHKLELPAKLMPNPYAV